MTYSTPLEEYYTTVYPSKCLPYSPKWLSTKEGLVFSSRLITLFSLPIQFLTVYCILKKTPESMNFVKKSLFNVNLWCIISGLVLSFVVTPFNFFPFFAGFTVGLAADFGFSVVAQFYIGLAMTFAILISITILFENRSSLISQNAFAIKKLSTKIMWISVNFFGAVILLTPVFYHLPDQMTAKMKILEDLPCPAPEFFTEPFLVLASSNFWKTYLTVTLMFIYSSLMLQIVFFSASCVYYLFIFKSSHVSPATRKLQIQSFYGIVGQTLIPILFESIPTVVFLNRQTNGDYDQFNNNLMGLSIVLHSGMASFSILLVHGAYRNFLLGAICGVKRKNVGITVSGEASRRV